MRVLSAEDDAVEVPPSAATIGVFDGMHRGHAAVLSELRTRAQRVGLETAVVTFRTHPKAVTVGNAPPSITSIEHRLALLERSGIDTTLVLDFDAKLRATTASEFLARWIRGRLNASLLVLGWDSKFGRDQRGTVETIGPLAKELGIEVHAVPPIVLRGRPISSTAIREAISLGDLDAARWMLGRDMSLFGTVVHGDHRGRELGFPTANLDLDLELLPPTGVYATHVLHGERFDGVMNLGSRPTFKSATPELVCEVHLLDFTGDLYGAKLEVSLIKRLRGEQRFQGPQALREAIANDIAEARRVLRDRSAS